MGALISITKGSKEAFLGFAPCQGENLFPMGVQVQDRAGKTFFVTSVQGPEDLSRIPKDLCLDCRIKQQDTEVCLSCFRGIDLDPNYTRAQIFLIDDGSRCVGVATLFVIPYKNLMREIYFKRRENKLLAQPFSSLFSVHPHSFVVETGWFQILPQYRHNKLGEAVLDHVIFPTIERLCVQSHEEIIVKCAATGRADKDTKEKLCRIMQEFLQVGSGEMPVSPAMDSILGQVLPEAIFTSNQALRMGCERLSDVFNRNLGPVFAKVITR